MGLCASLRARVQILSTHVKSGAQPGIVVYAFNLSAQEVETGGSLCSQEKNKTSKQQMIWVGSS